MEIVLLLALAIAPCIALILFVYFRDKYDKEPKLLLFVSFLLGAFSVLPTLVVELLLNKVSFIEQSAFMDAFFGTGFVEEGWKLFFILLVPYRRKSFNEPLDGIVYAVMVSMGFATVENIMYVINGGVAVGILRIFTAVPAHAMFAVIMGFFLGEAKFLHKNKFGFILIAYVAAGSFHGAYDYFLFEKNIPGIWLGAIVSLIVGLILSLKAIGMHRKLSKTKADQLAAEAIDIVEDGAGAPPTV